MRKISNELYRRIKSLQQTKYNNADPRAVIFSIRNDIPLDSSAKLEKYKVLDADGLTKVDIAVRHPVENSANDRIYIGYIKNGVAGVKFAIANPAQTQHKWNSLNNFTVEAVDIAIAFNGTMPKSTDGTSQFVTDKQPWIFWVTPDGAVMAKYGFLVYSIASSNAVAVSAVRGMWSRVGSFDFGLIVFFVLNGKIFYRQFIGGEWKDAEQVAMGPSDVEWVDISASRTWDYRIVLQAKDSNGDVYEIYSQFEGLAKQGTEHKELSSASISGEVLDIETLEQVQSDREHISATDSSITTRMYKPNYESGYESEHSAVLTDASISIELAYGKVYNGVENEAMEASDANYNFVLTKVDDI